MKKTLGSIVLLCVVLVGFRVVSVEATSELAKAPIGETSEPYRGSKASRRNTEKRPPNYHVHDEACDDVNYRNHYVGDDCSEEHQDSEICDRAQTHTKRNNRNSDCHRSGR